MIIFSSIIQTVIIFSLRVQYEEECESSTGNVHSKYCGMAIVLGLLAIIRCVLLWFHWLNRVFVWVLLFISSYHEILLTIIHITFKIRCARGEKNLLIKKNNLIRTFTLHFTIFDFLKNLHIWTVQKSTASNWWICVWNINPMIHLVLEMNKTEALWKLAIFKCSHFNRQQIKFHFHWRSFVHSEWRMNAYTEKMQLQYKAIKSVWTMIQPWL